MGADNSRDCVGGGGYIYARLKRGANIIILCSYTNCQGESMRINISILFLALALAFLIAAKQAQALFSTEFSIKNNILRSGKLSLAIKPSESLLSAENMTSGSTVENTLSIENNGTIATNVSLSAKKSAGYTTYFNALLVTVIHKEQVIYDGLLSQLQNIMLTTQPLAAATGSEYIVRVTLPPDAPNTVENSYANITFTLTAIEAT